MQRRVPIAVGVMLAVISASCDRTPSALPSPSSTTPSATVSKRAAAEAAAIAAYKGMWQAMARAAEIPDPDAPALRRYAAGDALARVVGALVNYRANGQVTRGRPVSHARVESTAPVDDPTEVNVVDCGDSTGWTTHHKATGKQIAPDPRGRRRITAVVRKIDGAWKVTTFDVGAIGSC